MPLSRTVTAVPRTTAAGAGPANRGASATGGWTPAGPAWPRTWRAIHVQRPLGDHQRRRAQLGDRHGRLPRTGGPRPRGGRRGVAATARRRGLPRAGPRPRARRRRARRAAPRAARRPQSRTSGSAPPSTAISSRRSWSAPNVTEGVTARRRGARPPRPTVSAPTRPRGWRAPSQGGKQRLDGRWARPGGSSGRAA